MAGIQRLAAELVSRNSVIAISGKSGCGNTTVTKALSARLGIAMVNYTFRNMAAEEGTTLEAIIERAAVDPEVDRHVDKMQVELASRQACVLGSRLAIWVYPEAILKVYLMADLQVRASRIHTREGGNLAEVARITGERDVHDHGRYLSLYGIDNDNYEFADLKIDTSKKRPDEIVDLIVATLFGRLGLTS